MAHNNKDVPSIKLPCQVDLVCGVKMEHFHGAPNQNSTWLETTQNTRIPKMASKCHLLADVNQSKKR